MRFLAKTAVYFINIVRVRFFRPWMDWRSLGLFILTMFLSIYKNDFIYQIFSYFFLAASVFDYIYYTITKDDVNDDVN